MRSTTGLFVVLSMAIALLVTGCVPKDEKAVQAAIEELTYDAINFVSGENRFGVMSDFEVPDTATDEVIISWESSEPDVISVKADMATVSRPGLFEGNRTVTLTATVSRSEESQAATFELMVLAESTFTELMITGAAQAYEFSVGALSGTSVAISGNYAIVGGPRTMGVEPLDPRGVAYVLERDGQNWSLMDVLVAPNMHERGGFGQWVAISGDYAIVAGYGRDAVYIFERNGSQWNSVERLLDSDKPEDFYGATYNSVAMDGSRAVVGRRNMAYFFERSGSNWIEVSTFKNPNSNEYNTQFGASVAISGDYAIVGDVSDDGDSSSTSQDSGAAYMYQRGETGWIQTEILRTPEGLKHDAFGASVAISGHYAVISSRGGGGQGGAAYIFERTGSDWNEIAVLRPAVTANSYEFGTSVAINGDTVIVGQPNYGAGVQEYDAGAVYVYQPGESGWNAVEIMQSSGRLGTSVAVSGKYVIAGAPWISAEKIRKDPYLATSIGTDLTGATFFYW